MPQPPNRLAGLVATKGAAQTSHGQVEGKSAEAKTDSVQESSDARMQETKLETPQAVRPASVVPVLQASVPPGMRMVPDTPLKVGKVPFNFRISAELHKRVKWASVGSGRSIQDIVEEGLIRQLDLMGM